MPIFASMLRGINVGGRTEMGMPALAEVYSSLGLKGVRTLLRSGNIVFSSEGADRAKLTARLADAIEARFGFRPAVFLRSPEELRAAVAANPFPAEVRRDPSRLVVIF